MVFAYCIDFEHSSIDKYYMLIRRFVNASFRLLMRAKWDSGACKEYNSILTDRGGPLWYALVVVHNAPAIHDLFCSPDDTRVPTSLAYHLSDIYLEELDKALANSPVESPLPAPLSTLLAPFFVLSSRTPTTITYQRIQTALIDPLLTALSPRVDSDDQPSRKRPRLSSPTFDNLVSNSCASEPVSEGAQSTLSLRKIVLKQLFDVASEPDTRDANRRRLYALWKERAEDDEEASGSDRSVDAS